MDIVKKEWVDGMKAIPTYCIVFFGVLAIMVGMVAIGAFYLFIAPIIYVLLGLLWILSLGHLNFADSFMNWVQQLMGGLKGL